MPVEVKTNILKITNLDKKVEILKNKINCIYQEIQLSRSKTFFKKKKI